jgi:aminoglycoside phosphotransferase (APT) family kinase protein
MQNNKRSGNEIKKFRGLAQQVIDSHFVGAKRLKYLSSGLTNFVFSFRADEEDFVIRISPDASRMGLFIKEQWAVNAARSTGIPVAQILEVGSELIGSPYMVVRAAEGGDAVNHPKRPEILRELGKLAAKIHGIRTKGFGQTFDWSDNRLSRNSSFKDWLYGEYDAEGKLALLEKQKLLTTERSRKLRKIFSNFAGMRVRPVLNHSDLRLKNVIADDDGKIRAIIDWEGCTSNVPAWDLSLALHDLGIDGTQHFLQGYGITAKKLVDQMPLIRAFNIANYASAAEAAAKDKELLAHYRLRLDGSLDLFSI